MSVSVLSVKTKWWCNPQACFPAIQSKNSLPFPALFIQQHELHQRKGCHSHNLIVPKSRAAINFEPVPQHNDHKLHQREHCGATIASQKAVKRNFAALAQHREHNLHRREHRQSHNITPKAAKRKFAAFPATPETQTAPKRGNPEPQLPTKSRHKNFYSN